MADISALTAGQKITRTENNMQDLEDILSSSSETITTEAGATRLTLAGLQALRNHVVYEDAAAMEADIGNQTIGQFALTLDDGQEYLLIDNSGAEWTATTNTVVVGDWATADDINTAIAALKGGVDAAGDTLAKLYALIGGKADLATLTALSNKVKSSVVFQGRPGDWIDGYGSSLTGPVDTQTPLAGVSGVSEVNDEVLGRALQVEDLAIHASQIAPTPILPGRVYELQAHYRRTADPADPAGDTVSLGVRWLNFDKSGIDGAAGNRVVTNLALQISDGAKYVGKGSATKYRFSLDVAGTEYTIPAAARYGRGYLRFYGTDHQTRFGMIELVDVTDRFKLDQAVAATASQLAISAFLPDVEVFEVGDTQTITLTWQVSGYYDVTAQSMRVDDGDPVPLGTSARSFVQPGVTETTTFQLSVTDSEGRTVSDTVTVEVLPKFYAGVSQNATLTNAQVLALASGGFSRTRAFTGTFDCSVNGGNNYVYYAFPAALGATQSFKIFGSNISLTATGVVSTQTVTNAEGDARSYTILRSPNPLNDAATPIEVL